MSDANAMPMNSDSPAGSGTDDGGGQIELEVTLAMADEIALDVASLPNVNNAGPFPDVEVDVEVDVESLFVGKMLLKNDDKFERSTVLVEDELELLREMGILLADARFAAANSRATNTKNFIVKYLPSASHCMSITLPRQVYLNRIHSLFFLKFFQYCEACGFMAP